MNHKNGEVPDNLGRLGDLLPADVLEKYKGSIVFNIYEKGSLHVDHVDSQNFYGDSSPKPMKGPKQSVESATKPFDADTPLSALFRESHHEELSQIIDSWRPYLKDNETDTDALAMSHFEFDFDKVIATHIYIDLGRLLHAHALKDDNMSLLAKYLFQHSNLSNSQSTLYVQLRKYKKR
jgi:hypothetical protein